MKLALPRPLVLESALLAALWCGVARAEPPAADRALATDLFHAGRSLMAEGKYPEACRKLEESQRLDPGGGTLLNLALCHEAEGKTATAWAELTQALGMARRDSRSKRIRLAEQHIAALEPKLSRLTIIVPAEMDVPELVVRRDASVIGPTVFGSPMPADPGDHTIEATCPGRTPFTTTITLGVEADQKTVSVPVLAAVEQPAAAPEPPAVVIEPPPRKTAPAPSKPAPAPTPAPAHTGNTAAYLIGGIGLAGLAVGGIFGAMTLAAHCDHGCDADALSSARSKADISTVGFAVGAVGVGLSVTLLLTSGPDRPAQPADAWLAPGLGSLRAGAHF